MQKCRRCKAPAVIDIRRHNTAFCADCFTHHCREQVRRAVHEWRMFGPTDRLLVAVSGGKDSLAVWDLLLDLGYEADGLYIGLGIDEYSDDSGHYARTFAEARGLTLRTVDLGADHGFTVPAAAAATRRAPCGSCGLSKRHLFNQVALDHGYDVVVTGHNLDDEAAVLLGNTMRWDTEYLARQFPVLEARPGLARKVKPLVRVSEREMAAYCVVRGIDYQIDECPMAAGNKHLGYKEMLNAIEAQSPGSKAAFLFNFFDRAHPRFAADALREHDGVLGTCRECGSPTTAEVCAFCALKHRTADVVAVTLRNQRTS